MRGGSGARSSRCVLALTTALVAAIATPVYPSGSAASAAGAPTLLSPANDSTIDDDSAELRVGVDAATTSVDFYGRRVGATVPGQTDEPDFTFVVIPDTQNYAATVTRHWMIDAQTQWIVDHRDDLNVAFVAQVGDLVSDHTISSQWNGISRGMAVLDTAGVPNAVVPGNHDFDNATGAIGLYDTYFPVSRYADASWNSATVYYGGYLGSNDFGPDPVDRRNMNSYAVFEAGGLDFLVLSLEWEAPAAVMQWADKIIDAHPDHTVILSTHSFINVNGARLTSPQRPGGTATQTIWTQLVAPNCNVKLVVNGHFHSGNLGEARRTDNNSCGQPVHQILSDYQERPNGGNGWLRYYTFSPSTNTVTATTYSPTLGQFETDADSSFTLPFGFTQPQPAPFTKIGSATPSGGTAGIDWPDLERQAQYEWYAVAREPGRPDATGGVARFTVPASPVLIDDTFTRTTTSGWGAADGGQVWSLHGTVTNYSVSGGLGRIAVPPGQTRTASIPGVVQEASLLADVAIDQRPNASTYLSLVGRLGSGDYRAKLVVGATGTAGLRLVRFTGGVETTLASFALPDIASGARHMMRFEYTGQSPTTLRARVWRAGTAEPSTWQVQATDSTMTLQAPGAFGINAFLSGSATANAPISIDRFTASRIGATPQPPTTTTTTTTTTPPSTTTTTTIPPSTTTTTIPPSTTTTTTSTTTTSTSTTTTTTLPPVAGAVDSFGRTVSNGWGTSDSGHVWTVAGTASRYSVAGGRGLIRLSATGTDATASFGSPSSTSSEIRLDLSFDKVGSTLYATTITRRVDAANGYRVKVVVNANGRIRLQLVRRVGGTDTTLSDVQLPDTITNVAGRTFSLAAQATGTGPTTLRAKLWVTGQTEPLAWQTVAQDSTPVLQTAGTTAINHYLSSSGSALVPLTMSIDNVRVTTP